MVPFFGGGASHLLSSQFFKVMFCRVCGIRVRVWESFRTSRSLGYGYGSVTELTEVPGTVAWVYRTHRSSGRVQNMLYPYPGCCGTGRTELTEISGTGMKVLENIQKISGTGMKVSQNFQKFRVYITSRSSGYYGTGVQKLQKFRVGMKILYPYPGYLWHFQTQNLQKFRVRVLISWRTCRSSGSGTGKTPGKYMASGEEFDLEWRIRRLYFVGFVDSG